MACEVMILPIVQLHSHPLAVELLPPQAQDEYEALAADIEEQGILHPLLVVKGDGGYAVVDGLHRLDAARALGLKEVPVVVLEPTSDKDLLKAVLSPNTLRRHLKSEQKWALVGKVLKMHPDYSNRLVARLTGVSHPTVGKVRRAIESPEQAEKLPAKHTSGDSSPYRTEQNRPHGHRRGATAKSPGESLASVLCERLDGLNKEHGPAFAVKAARDVARGIDRWLEARTCSKCRVEAVAPGVAVCGSCTANVSGWSAPAGSAKQPALKG